jgi:hypothetical protein
MSSARFAFLTLAALALPAAAQAQRVTADIAIASGPVSGRIIVGERQYPRPVYREVVVVRSRRGAAWYHNRHVRVVRVYFDVDRGRYYDRGWRPGLRVVEVYQDGGRYYRVADRDHDRRDNYLDRRDGRHHDRDHFDRD